MKKVSKVLVALMALFMSVGLFAQGNDKTTMRVVKEVEEMAKVMKLDDQQKAKMVVIKKELAEGKNKINSECADNKEQRGVRMKELNKKYNEQYEAICTQEQRDLWKKFVDDSKKANKK